MNQKWADVALAKSSLDSDGIKDVVAGCIKPLIKRLITAFDY